jgi:autotransporter-associated beta strand protein
VIDNNEWNRKRRRRAALLASTALVVATAVPATGPARAQDATWLANPGSAEYSTGSNWDTGSVPTGTATFGTSTTTALTINSGSTVNVDGWVFYVAGYNITNSDTLYFNGAGISGIVDILNLSSLSFLNSWAGSSSLYNHDTLTFRGASNAAAATVDNFGVLGFYDTSSAGFAVITNEILSTANFYDTSSAAAATITNSGTLNFRDAATADASITNNNTGTLNFYDTSSAGHATLQNAGVVNFTGNTTAGSASITNNSTLNFTDTSTAGSASITNNDQLYFFNASTAGTATIINNNSFALLSFVNTSTAGNASITNNGSLYFNNTSTAGSASITNDGSGNLNFIHTSTAGSASISNSGTMQFSNTSSAGSAVITNNGSGNLNFIDTATAGSASISNSGTMQFSNTSSAGSATITNNSSGTLNFFATSTAGSAVVTNNGALTFEDNSTAGGATITNGGSIYFEGTSTAGSAVITNSGTVLFDGNSTAGSAQLINSGSSAVINFWTTGPASDGRITAGSIEGSGGFYLGANELTVGNNNLSTTVTGLIDDGGLGGSLVKVGTGTLTLGGYNSFYGGVTLNAGTLKLANNGALGYGVLTTAGGTVAYADGVTIGNAIDLRANTTLDVTAGSATQAGVIGETGGAFGVVKTGTGTLTLSGTNTYTGGTTFAGGTVSVSSDANLGDAAGGLTFNGGALQVTGTTFNSTARTMTLAAGGGTFDIANAANQFTVSEAISGAGGLTKSGAGTLILTAANTYSGATTVSAGTLNIQGSIASSTVTNNATLVYSNSATAGSATITNNASGTIEFYNTSTAGNASITNNNQLMFYGDTSAGSATITNYGTVLFDGDSTAGSAQLINSGSSAVVNFWTPGPASDGRITAGSLAGDGRFDLNSAELTVGSNNLSTEVTGVLTGDGLFTGTSLIKTGTGTLTLSGTNTFLGGVRLNAGTLALANDGALGTGVLMTVGGTVAYANGVTIGNAVDLRTGTTFNVAAGSATQAGVIGETGGAFGVVKTGTGTLTLTATNTYTGATTINGGTLQIGNGGTTGSVAGDIADNAALIFNRSDNVTYSGVISGSGTLEKLGAGTLALSGANTYTGATTVSAGTLTIQDSIASSRVTNNATLVYSNSATAGSASITNNASGTLEFHNTSTAGNASITNNNQLMFYGDTSAGSATITNYGTVLFDGDSTAGSAQLINSGSSAVVNFWTPGPASDGRITAGSLAGDGRFDLNSVELTVGSNNLSTEVTGVLTGDGLFTGTSLIKTGTGTLTLSGTNTYTGATIVYGGTLSVNGSIASSDGLWVNSGSTLGGTGFVPTTVINNGATLAPGNSIGTLTVNGNLTFNTGGFYAVEVSPTAADRTNVSGIATLTGATVQAAALSGSFRSQTYTILNATGGFGGTQFAGMTFSGSSISPGARNPHLTYDLNNVFLVLDPGTLQLSSGASGNQTNVAGGINNAVLSGGTPPAGFDTLLNLSGSQQGNALNQVSGQPGAGSTQASFGATQQFMAMLDPASGHGGDLGSVTSFAEADESFGYTAASERGIQAREAYAAVTPRDRRNDAFEGRWGIWASGYGGTSTVNGNAAMGTSTTTSRVYGTVVGTDRRVSPDTIVGFALGGAGFNFSLSDGLGSGRADLFQAGLYGRHTIGAAYLSASLAYGWHDVTTDRTVTVSGTDKLTANYKANTFATRVETGWRLSPWPTAPFGLTPYGALQVTSFHLPGYSETAPSGSSTFALSYSAETTTNVRTELGARVDAGVPTVDGLLTLRGRLAWAHDSNTDRPVTAAFQTLPGATFTVNGAQPAVDSALVSAGAEMKWLNGVSLAGSFEGEFSDTTRSYAGKGTLRYAW